MRHRILERAAAAGVALSLVATATAFADSVRGDADTVAVGVQASRDLGEVAPGAVLAVPVGLALACSGSQHLDAGQAVVVAIDAAIVPGGGAIAMDPVTLGPVPAAWPRDGEWCSGSEPPITGTGAVVVTAPASLGSHEYSILFSRAPTPAGSDDGMATAGTTAASLTLTVVAAANTPPQLVLPPATTVVADGPDGWTASFVASAVDAEDDPDPVPSCIPAVGDLLPVGTTTIECSVVDTGGLRVTGSFDITVEPAPGEPKPEPEPGAPPVATFEPPVRADGLEARVGRTVPVKVRLAAGDEPIGEGSLVLVVAPCAGGDPVARLDLEWRAASDRWFGLLRTRGLEPGCHLVRAEHDGVVAGRFELQLVGGPAAAARGTPPAAREHRPAARDAGGQRASVAKEAGSAREPAKGDGGMEERARAHGG
jgi:hypothetical protein